LIPLEVHHAQTHTPSSVLDALITRKSIEYQVMVDFATILSQLENKGIMLQSLECPSCKGQLEYPKEGNSITCKFCGATIAAIDVFEKFKALLS
jgi:LSD1 subclass zinc finger protein